MPAIIETLCPATITAGPDGHVGQQLTGQEGEAATITLNGKPIGYPVTLQAGDVLNIERPVSGKTTRLVGPLPGGGGSGGLVALSSASKKTLGPYAESDPTTGVGIVRVQLILQATAPTTLAAVAIRMGQLVSSAEPTLTFNDSLGREIRFIPGTLNGEWMEYLLPEPYTYNAGDMIALTPSGERALYNGTGTQTVGDWTSEEGTTLGLRLSKTTVTTGAQKGVVGPLDFTDFPVVTNTDTVPQGGVAIWLPPSGGAYLIYKSTAVVRLGVKLEPV